MSPAFLQTYTKFAWGTGILLELTGAILIIRRRLWRDIPAFSTYLIYSASADITGAFLFLHPLAYYYFYWSSQAAYKILNTWVVLEIYARLMRAFPALRKAAAWTLCCALAIAVASALFVWFFAPLAQADPVTQRIDHIGYSLKMLQLGLLLAVAFIVHFFRLRLRRYYVFIAIGLAIIGLGDLSSYVMTSAFGYAKIHFINAVSITINLVGDAVWVYVLLTGEATQHPAISAAIPITDLRDWNTTLSDLDRP